LQSPIDWIVDYHLTSHDLQSLTHAVHVEARRSFEHSKFDDSARIDVAVYRCASNCCRDWAHLDLCAALVVWHIKQKLSATQLDRPPASNVVNSFLAQTRDRFIFKGELAPGLAPGLHRVALTNSLVDCHRARRCTGWHYFNVLYHLSNLCFLEILGRQVIWQPIYQGTYDWGDEQNIAAFHIHRRIYSVLLGACEVF